ncbi:MAG: MoaD/ThiS family protein [Candidatus Aenigmarchaeota archaeon]|nr:MoaD/ThiS family protein [Candidatus Aenigmarchaeota archaeon]
MKIVAELQGRKHTLVLPDKAKAIDAVQKLGVNPETVLVRRGREIITDDEPLANNDKIELIKVVSGG